MFVASSSSRRSLGVFALLASVVGVLPVVACSSPPPVQPVSSSPKPSATPTSAPIVSATASATASAGPVAARPVCPVDPEPAAPAPTGKKVVSISMGMERACAVLEDGRLTCWGGRPRLPPTVVPGVDEAIQVAVVGHTHDALVVRKDGALLRVPQGGAATKIPGLGEVVEVAAGVNVVAARAKDGTVQVTEILPGAAKLTWQKLPARGVKQVSAGGHVCALDTAEQVSCFTVDGKKIRPYSIPALGAVKRLASGGAATCATLADGTNRCFEVGQGPSYKPIDLPAGKLVGVASLEWNDGPMACVDTKDGLACKWLNLGSDGEISYLDKAPPAGSTRPGTVEWVSNGKSACLRGENGKVSCWGYAGHGLLGEPDPAFVSWPTKVPGVEGAVSLVTGSLYTCASLDDGQVTCWGDRGEDQSTTLEPKVRLVPGVANVAKLVRVDSDEFCAVKKDGAVTCLTGRAGAKYRPPADAPALAGFRQVVYLNGKSTVALLTGQGAVHTAYPFGTLDARMTNVEPKPLAGMPAAARLLEGPDLLIAITEKEQAWTSVVGPEGKLEKPKREPRLDGAKRLVSHWAVLWNDGTVSFGDPRKGTVKREKTPSLVDLLDGRGPDSRLCGITSEGAVMCRDGDSAWSRLPGLPKVVAADSYWGQACVIDTCGAAASLAMGSERLYPLIG